MRFVRAIWKLLVGIKDALVLLFMLLFFGLLYAALSARPAAIGDGVLAMDLDGVLVEQASRPDAIMLPQEGAGGCTPRPRNERPASSRIAFPTPSAAATITEVATLGTRWRTSNRRRPDPSATAASTNGRSSRARDSA